MVTWYSCRCCCCQFSVIDCRYSSAYTCPQCGEYGIHRVVIEKEINNEKTLQNVEKK